MRCQFKDCTNEATKVVWKPILGIDEEPFTSYPVGGGTTLPAQERIVLCDEHEEQFKAASPKTRTAQP